jgi:hypothetical protein
MSWDRTYSHTALLGIDRLGAALLFNEPDITISSLAWVVRSGSDAQRAQLQLYGWQRSALSAIGSALEYFWPGHCARARTGDLATSTRARTLLGALTP